MSDDSGKRSFLTRPAGIASIVIAVLALAGGGYYAFTQGLFSKNEADSAASQVVASGTCGVALSRVKDYGVVPSESELSGSKNGTSADGRIACDVSANETRYAVLVNKVCDNLAETNCLEIYSVTQDGGEVLFQQRAYAY